MLSPSVICSVGGKNGPKAGLLEFQGIKEINKPILLLLFF